MKALVCERYGSPDVLQLKEVERPVPGDNEVLVKIHATTVNRTDNAYIKAIPFFTRLITGLLKPKYPIPGTEFAGEVISVGDQVTSFAVGDRVFGFNDRTYGSHAEYMTVPEHAGIIHIPDGITYEQAAASSEGAFYGWNFINKVPMESGLKILVNGASGAIGSATVQLLRVYDVEVTAVVATENLELARTLGADHVIDYTKEDFTKRDEKFNYVFDTVGKSSYPKCRKLLLPGGVYISSDLGFMWQNVFWPLITKFVAKKKVRFPIPEDITESLYIIKERMEKGTFTSVIDRTYPLDRIIEAYRYVEKGQKTGNVVIKIVKTDGSDEEVA